ncbi:MAG TPA: dephospho-CoA kinase [Propionibacteriaceae bacterium]|nr:dephospho-CoA kinase [Propionibacteriaceae bacterium]
MLRVGLTGGIASGKSTVANELARRGAVIIDADELAREVVQPGTPGLAAVARRFGDSVLAGGQLDRAALAKIVFADSQARRDLEGIIHPAVRRRAAELEAAVPHRSVIVHVIPLLVETSQESDFDLCVVVDVDHQTQLERLMTRGPMSREEAESRIAAQATREQRLAAADIVVQNVGTINDLRKQLDDLWSDLVSVDARE